jgi:DNA polymerase III delta subunit
LTSPSPFGYLIVSLPSVGAAAALYTKGKKEWVACDVSEEKPWERERRLRGMAASYALRSGKRWREGALDALLRSVGPSLPALEQGIDQVGTYVGERPEVTSGDVATLHAPSSEQTLWQLIDQIAWGSTYPTLPQEGITDLLIPLIIQLRTQYQNALSVSALRAKGLSTEELARHLPHIRPQQMTKILQSRWAESPRACREALEACFQAELGAKSGGAAPETILDLFIGRLLLVR